MPTGDNLKTNVACSVYHPKPIRLNAAAVGMVIPIVLVRGLDLVDSDSLMNMLDEFVREHHISKVPASLALSNVGRTQFPLPVD